jgi:restriction endonuclease S subunit
MALYKEYNCAVCKNISNQKSHHDSHLKTEKHKKEIKILKLELAALSKEDILEKYGSTNINEIVNKLETYESEINEDYIDITLSNNDTLRDKIHDIHNFLRNSGVGYGMTALKIFNIFYGLKKLEMNNNFKKTGLGECCRFSNIYNSFNTIDISKIEKAYEMFISKTVNEELYNSEKLDFLFYLIPDSIKGETIKRLVILIDELCNMENKLNVQLSGKIYEYFIGRDESAISELGAYFTDRHITRYIYNNLLKPELDENDDVYSMIDMFGGSGGFTIGYIDYLIQNYNNINWKTQIKKVNHYDMNEDVIKSAMLEFYCLTGEFSDKENMKCVNSFQYDFGTKKYRYIITNPPYGGDKNKKSENVQNLELIKKEIDGYFKEKYKIRNMKEISKIKNKLSDEEKTTIKQYDSISIKLKHVDSEKNNKNVNLGTSHDIYKEYAEKYGLSGSDKEAVSLIMMMALLEENGTAIGVLKEGMFFDRKYSLLRKCLVENFNVKKIVSVPADQFENTATKTSIIMFENTEEKTSKIDFYNLIIEKDEKTTAVRNEQGIYKIDTIKNKITKVYHEEVSTGNLNEIVDKNYSFNNKDYNKNEIICGVDYQMVKLGDICKYLTKSKRNASYGKQTGKYKFYTSSNNIKRCDEADYDDECIIIGTGGNSCIHYNKDMFSCSGDTLLLHFENLNAKYIYYTLLSNWALLTDNMHGSIIKHVTKEMLSNFKIPLAKSKDKIQYWINKISKPYDEKNIKLKEIKKLEKSINNKIDQIINEEECEEVKLDDICDINLGTRITKNNNSISETVEKYPVYGGGDITFYTKSSNRSKNTLIISRYALSKVCVRLISDEFYLNDSGMSITCKDNLYQSYINYYLLTDKMQDNIYNNCTSGSIQKNINMNIFKNIKFKIPKNKEMIKALEVNIREIENLYDEMKVSENIYNQYIKDLGEDAIPLTINYDNILIDDSDNEIKNKVTKSSKRKSNKKKIKTMIVNI